MFVLVNYFCFTCFLLCNVKWTRVLHGFRSIYPSLWSNLTLQSTRLVARSLAGSSVYGRAWPTATRANPSTPAQKLVRHPAAVSSSRKPLRDSFRPRLQATATPRVYSSSPPTHTTHTHTHSVTTTRADHRSAVLRFWEWTTTAGHEKKRASRVVVGGDGLERKSAFEREMLLMEAPVAAEQQQKRRRGRPLAADLLENCDLPPPAKLFGPLPTLRRLEHAAGVDQKGDGDGGIGGNDSLLRALRLSQSRAREAEQKLAAAGASNGDLAALLVRDSVALSAHRRWVMMLEAENSALRAGGDQPGAEPEEEDDGRRGMTAWWVALAVCVGIAGVGLALGNLLL